MSIFSLFRKQQRSAPMARERLQVLLAHERASLESDLVSILREEILAVIAKHVEFDRDKVRIKMDRDDDVSILEIDVEIPLNAARLAA
ncbi:cell division topological specificity factor MinE [Rhizobium sp. 18065]|uniref:cell division topological specificity factor MinE n=1 Tax=Rhizobium sp. 18065 TaxID=2681411 RepID=UPI00135779F4|nr:cell division topological specificity factor MinE [Rhizobium sp. 18065]